MAFCDFCNCRPVADGADLVGVVIALNCFSFRCRWLSRTGANAESHHMGSGSA